MLIKNPIVSLISTGWTYAGKRRHLILIYLGMFAMSQALSLAEPYVVGKLLNCVQVSATGGFKNGTALLHQIYFYLGLLFATQVGFWAFHGPGRLIERFVAYHIKADYKQHMFKIVTALPLQWHRSHHSGDSIDKINKASNALSLFYDSTFEVSYMIFCLIGTQIILFCFMPLAGAAAFITSCVSIAVILTFDKFLIKIYKQLNLYDNRVASAVHDYVTNIISVITLRLENRVIVEIRRRLMTALPLFNKSNLLNETKWCLTTVLISLMVVSVLAVYATSCINSKQVLMTGTFFTLFEYLRRLGDCFYNFAYLYGTTVSQAADVEGAQPLFDSFRELSEASAKFELPRSWSTISVRDLNFTYSDERHRTHHLENVALTLSKGKAIAFVGQSGSGKSTLLNLLRGMQQADHVEVECDGQVLPGKLHHLAEITTLLPQDPEIFADTIKFNITFGLDADDEQIERAIEIARFKPVLARLPERLETNIAEKGVNLSGGEKQRLALARGMFFARESDILLLDEPTSSVDSHNERVIYANMLKEFSNKCIISSIHKLHLLDMFDEIYFFDDGRLIEQGDLNSLISANGPFAALWKHSRTADQIQLAEPNDISIAV